MSIKGKLEAIIYAAEDPVTVEQIAVVLKEEVLSESGLQTQGMEPKAIDAEVRSQVRAALAELDAEYASSDRGMEVRQVAGGYRMATKPEHHDAVRAFVKSLKPPMKLSLQALETLAVIAYKQPVTAPEITEIRGVESSGVLSTLLDRKLIATAGRKQVVGRPILYKTSKEFLLRFGLKDVSELPSLEEFEKMTADGQEDLFADGASEAAAMDNPATETSAEPTTPETEPAESR
ncbi:MAG: SMC-Scp complex subunit ScpB [Candidatus Korobacteraceae bacterium]